MVSPAGRLQYNSAIFRTTQCFWSIRMTRGGKEDALFGRESLFRQKLDQLRTTGEIKRKQQIDPMARVKELESSSLLAGAHGVISGQTPNDHYKLTMLDSLTELYNHDAIVRIFKEELKRARRYKQNESLVIIRVDQFDEIVQSHGKLVGDSILKGLSNFLMKLIRDVDIPARYDGQHFAVVLPATDLKGTLVLAERIRSRVSYERLSEMGQNWNVTVSIGIASFPDHSPSPDELIQKAMQACANARMQGGDSVYVTP
ncbi:MAG: hypothetical protein C0507_08850 [Cyanobacteria bacterium PR.3.49]|nr:hypothetical protein [Cyanobacteria bacterium PR.3.49]